MVEECTCGHYRADHGLSADRCGECVCLKFRFGRLVHIRDVHEALVELLRIQDMPEDELDGYPEGLLTEIADEAWEQARNAVKQAKGKVKRI